MNRSRIKTVFILVVSLSFLWSSKAQTTQINTKSPNIIFILADDLGIGDLGCYGQKEIKTLNIDKLAAQGMLFSNHYSGSTVCAPSRSVLMTGQHTGHTSIRDNKGGEVKGSEGQTPMSASSLTIAEILKQKGYATGAFGKWGLGFIGTTGDPNKQGFDEFYGYNCQAYAHRYYPEYLWHNDKKVFLPGNDWEHTVTYAPDLIHNKALEFIEKNSKKPFFLYYPTTIPHAELIVPDDEIFKRNSGKYKEDPYTKEKAKEGASYGPGLLVTAYCPQEQPKATYKSMVERLDIHVGDVVEKLKELGLEKNTIIFFASDNGIHQEGGIKPEDFDSNGIYRGHKRDMYEGGVKTPMIATWPGTIKSGSSTNHISAFWDILPTITELARCKTPSNIDGFSLVPTLMGKGNQKKHDYLYWEFHAENGKQAIRQGKWKAIKLNVLKKSASLTELYDLDADPSETTNLAAKFPEKVKEMEKLMDKQHTESQVFPFYTAIK
jgi:arylsulfatase A-like enzyme